MLRHYRFINKQLSSFVLISVFLLIQGFSGITYVQAKSSPPQIKNDFTETPQTSTITAQSTTETSVPPSTDPATITPIPSNTPSPTPTATLPPTATIPPSATIPPTATLIANTTVTAPIVTMTVEPQPANKTPTSTALPTTGGYDCAQVSQIPLKECQALIAFYNANNGASWINNSGWLQNDTPCSWFGVSCNQGHVSSLSFNHNNLTGTHQPEELANLAELREFKIFDDMISGQIPPVIRQMRKLVTLNLWGNRLSGPIPAWLGKLQYLEYLNLSDNHLTGRFPLEITTLPNLKFLYIDNTLLEGPIPSQIGRLTKLQGLSIGGENFTGSIPEEIVNLTQLTTLSIDGLKMEGKIPDRIGNLTSLTILYMRNSNLSGHIPNSLGNLTNLTWLDLSHNKLEGPIPSSLGNLNKLVHAYLNFNKLSGDLPSSLGNLSSIYDFQIENNQFTGNIPASFSQLINLGVLNVNDNPLSGQLPLSLENLIYNDFFEMNISNTNLCAPADDQFSNWARVHLNNPNGICLTAPALIHPVYNDFNPWPNFTWNAVPGAVGYQFILAENTDFTNPVEAPDILSTPEYDLHGLPEGHYFWHVRAQNAAGKWSPWSAIYPFTVDFTGPRALKPNNNIMVSGNNITFRWTKLDHDVTYVLQIDTDPNFSNYTYYFDNITTTSYTVSSLPAGTYYWRVFATYPSHVGSNPTETRQFTVVN